jgi:Exonuclease/UvrD-like helicase C-terminal domain
MDGRTVDGACAATILREAVVRYLGQELAGEFTRVSAPGPQLEMRLGDGDIRPGEGRPPVVLRPARGSLSYNLSTLAWRLAQELLVAYETTGSEPLVAYDLETTDADVGRDEIVEIAAQRLEQGGPAGPLFYSLVRPGRGIPLAASRVHGIYPEDVRRAPRIEAVLPEFLRYVGPFTVVGHNIIRFDNRLLDRETARLYGRGFPNPREYGRRRGAGDEQRATGQSQSPALSAGAAAAFEACMEELPAAVPPPADEGTWAALQERFAGQVETFVRFSPDHSLAAFLDYQALVNGADTAQGVRRGDRVSLMTLPNAKGTEFPIVILIGMEEDHLPLWTTLEDEGQLREER